MSATIRSIVIAAVCLFVFVLHVVAQEETPPAPSIELLQTEVLDTFDHDPTAFTQGLLLHDGLLYESTGQYGESSLRAVDPATGEVLRRVDLAQEYFAEGLALVDDRLIQLTWKEETALVYDLETFEQRGSFAYAGEGWGLCFDGEQLVMSDGSDQLTLRDPQTFAEIERVAVTVDGQPVVRINELECVGDHVYANIWQTDFIIRIETATGQVDAVIDASRLLTPDERAPLEPGAVLNGIAYIPDRDTFYITGKLWPKLFEVRFVPYNP